MTTSAARREVVAVHWSEILLGAVNLDLRVARLAVANAVNDPATSGVGHRGNVLTEFVDGFALMLERYECPVFKGHPSYIDSYIDKGPFVQAAI